jgi:hypothetical protein
LNPAWWSKCENPPRPTQFRGWLPANGKDAHVDQRSVTLKEQLAAESAGNAGHTAIERLLDHPQNHAPSLAI